MPDVDGPAVRGIDAQTLIALFNDIEPLTPFGEEQFDRSFDELGYDSLFLLEVSNRLDRDHGMEIPDGLLLTEHTPRAALTIIAGAVDSTRSRAL